MSRKKAEFPITMWNSAFLFVCLFSASKSLRLSLYSRDSDVSKTVHVTDDSQIVRRATLHL